MNESAEIEIIEPKYGACRFCHQICIDADDPKMTQSERDEVATLHCKCPQAYKYQRMTRDIENANRKISLLFGASASSYGFTKVDDDTIELLKTAASMIGNEKIRSAYFSVGAADTAKISATSKGTIKVERLKSVRCQME